MLTALERVLRHRVVLVLATAGIVDVVTGDPAAHGLALVAVAVALLAEQVAERRVEPSAEARPRAGFRVTTPMAILALVYAVVTGAFARFSWPLTIAVAVPGVAAVTFAWLGTPTTTREDPGEERPSALPWVVVLLALAAWEVQALLLQPSLTTSSWAHPTLSTLMDSVLVSHVGRSISLFIWLALGGYLLER